MAAELIEPLSMPVTPADQAALVELLAACVRDGASIGFLEPLDRNEAEAYWRKVIGEHAIGSRLLIVAREVAGSSIIGSAQLAFESRANGKHRAEVQKLMVLPHHRRRGLASRLMAALEIAASSRRLRLLFLDTSSGKGGATAFYQAQGYTLVGSIPEYAADPNGSLVPNAIFYKLLPPVA
jgi:acetyltransferase